MEKRKISFKKIFGGDTWIWVCFLVLSIISAIFVFSSIGSIAGESPVATWIKKHVLFIVASWGLAVVISWIDYNNWKKFSIPIFIFCFALLVAVMMMGGRWLSINDRNLFQPSEIAKIGLIILLAAVMAGWKECLQELSFFGILCAIVGVTAFLIVRENFSTAALVCVVCFTMMLFGGVNFKYWATTVLVVGIGAVIFLGFSYMKYKAIVDSGIVQTEAQMMESGRQSTWGHRVYTFIHYDPDELNQINMARMAIASGKLTGVGVGNTIQARLMTQSQNDFIYSIIIEEAGLFVGLLVFVVYAVLCWRCFKMARRCTGDFGSLLISGLGALIFLQALLHIFYNVGILPVTGQNLPLVSMGGTSYVAFGGTIGIIQNVCRQINNDKAEQRKKAEAVNKLKEIHEIAQEQKS